MKKRCLTGSGARDYDRAMIEMGQDANGATNGGNEMNATPAIETLTQMIQRLMRDHGWDRYTALIAAEYYRCERGFGSLAKVGLTADQRTAIINAR